MAKHLNYSVSFTPDTSALQRTMQNLQTQLQAISSTKIVVDDGSMKAAVQSAKDLQKYLLLATDATTGNLDLGKFSSVLKNAGTDVTQLSTKLMGIGPQGNQAFMTLARGISQAQIPMKKTNKLMDELWTTMKNTARWQLTSSVMHGFMGAIQSAIGYAEDLNKSLTDIRIVSEQSSKAMDEFAIKANKSAKALSTTTNEYAKASLIYFQQGLNGQEVEERTETTIKMANVVGESASDVSSYMTAIWNNFADGSHELEYYGDAMTALGAKTAASSAEIAEGLEKFASIGETVGLSYEYATAAVATVVDKTRQSASTVGTAFKTIFSRLQGLQLGETLEDGTDLNKYSEALEVVGINIKEADGGLKDMDTILGELGAKWQLLNDQQKMALATTVAGTRQYTQLISLMDNYDDFKVNVDVAADSEGTLDRQAEIYADSWEAASNRVRASLESVYDKLINDDAVIGLMDGFSGVIDSVGLMTDEIDGFGNILVGVASIFVNKFSGKIAQELGRLGDNFKVFIGKAKTDMMSMQDAVREQLTQQMGAKGTTPEQSAEMDSMANLIAAKQKLAAVSGSLTDTERAWAEQQIKNVEIISKQVHALSQVAEKKREAAQQTTDSAINSASKRVESDAQDTSKGGKDAAKVRAQNKKALQEYAKGLQSQVKAAKDAEKTLKKYNKTVQQAEKQMQEHSKATKLDKKALDEYKKQLTQVANSMKGAIDASDDFEAVLKDISDAGDFDELLTTSERVRMALEETARAKAEVVQGEVNGGQDGMAAQLGLTPEEVQGMADSYGELEDAVDDVSDATERQEEVSEGLDMSHTVTGTERVLGLASAAGGVYTAFQSIQSLGSIWADDDATVGEKIMSTLMTMSMLIPSVMTAYEGLSTAMGKNTLIKGANAAADAAVEAGTDGVSKAKKTETGVLADNTAAWFSNPITAIIAAACLAAAAAILIVVSAIKKNTAEMVAAEREQTNAAAQAAKEQAAANAGLIDSYDQALAKYKETGEGLAELVEASNAVCEAYGIEGAAVAALTGDYDGLTEAIKRARAEEVAAAKEKAEAAVAANADTFVEDMRDGTGNFSDGNYNAKIGGGASSGDEKKVQDIAKTGDFKYVSADGNDLNIKTAQTAEEMAAAYEEVLAIYEEAGRKMTESERASSENYQNMKKWLDKSKESYEAYIASKGDVEAFQIEETVLTSGENAKIGMDVEDVKTLEDYRKYRDAVVAETASAQGVKEGTEEWDKIKEGAEAYLGTLENITDLQAQDKAFGELASTKGIDQTKAENYFNSLSEEDRSLFWQINFDTAKTEEAWNAQMENIKAKAELDAVQVKIEAVETAQGALKEDMTAEDYDAIKNSGIDWGNAEEGIIKFSDFVKMSYTEQQKYLEGLNTEYKDSAIETAEAAKEAALGQIDSCEAAIEELESKLDDDSLTEEQKIEIKTQIEGYKQQKEDLLDDIDEIDADLEIDVKINRDKEFNDLLGDLEDMKGVNDSLVKDIKKVGSNYELTAEQARSWVSVYPELMKNATITSEGIVQLNADQVNEFIKGKEAELMAEGEAEIAKLEITRAGLVAKKEKAVAELELANAVARGEVDIETALTQTLAGAEQQLTDYLMQLGMEEADAQAAAAAAKAGNMEEYQRITADVADNNAYNLAYSMAASADATSMNAQQMVNSIDAIGQQAANTAEQIGAMAEGNVTYDGAVSVSGGGVTKNDFIAQVDGGNFKAGEYTKATTSDIEITQWQDRLLSDIGGYDSAIAEIDTRIAEIRAGMASSLNTYTPGTQRNSDVYDEDGGGSDSDKEKDVEELEEVAERYHEINREIEYYNSLLDENSKKKDRAYGKDKLKYMKEEQRLLEEKYKREKDLFNLQTAFLASDQKAVEDSFTGAVFDKESGELTNYTDMLQQATDKLNAAKTTYNNSAQEDSDKDALEKAEEEYDKQIALLEQYEETLDEWRQQKSDLQDLANEIYDAKLEELDYKVNLQVEFSDDELSYLEYLLERIENKAFSAAEAIANLGLQTQSVQNKSGAYKDGIMDIFGNHGLTEDDFNKWMSGDQATKDKIAGMSFTEDEVEKLREYTNGLMETNQAMIELRQSVHDKILSTFEEMNAEIDKGIEKLKHLQAMTESYGNIIDLVGKANFKGSEGAIKALNASKVTQAGNVVNANIDKRDMIAANLQSAKDTYAQQYAILSEEERKMWEDSIAGMESQLQEAEQAAMSSIEEWMTAINDQFIAEVEATMDRFSESVSGKFKNLAELQEAFERKQSENDRYLEDYEKIYEFSKLNRDIEKSIDNSDNIKAKKELADLQAEINELEESGAEISEYQMENLRKRYELKLAELALEEAQNAKSEVRMTRDSEGNWGYVYTADEAQVAEAEQSYEDKLYELQQQNAEYINTLQENIIQMQVEMKEKMAEIANDESLSIEERQAKMAGVQADYKEQMDSYCSELGVALGNNKTLYEDDWIKYSEATDYKIAEDAKYIDSFEETDLAILTGFTNMEGYQAAFNAASDTMLADNNTAFENWQSAMETGPLAAMDTSFDTLAENIDGHLDTIDQESDNTKEAIKEDCEDAVENYQGVVDAVVAWETQYSQSIDNMIADSDLIIAKFQEVLALWADVKAAAAEEPPTPPSESGGESGDGGGDGGAAALATEAAEIITGVHAGTIDLTDGGWAPSAHNLGYSDDAIRIAKQAFNDSKEGAGYSYYYEQALKLVRGYDTGGYTGEWGDASGRLALLHQKELVLNEDDTSNFLSAIEMIRQISSMIDLNAMSSMKGLGALLSAGGVGAGGGNFEQHIEIHASFPDANDHSEIEEAFNNLLNSASQYANRKL